MGMKSGSEVSFQCDQFYNQAALGMNKWTASFPRFSRQTSWAIQP